MNLNLIVEKVTPYIVMIETPSGQGTGFLYLYNQNRKFCCIATALHVIEDSNEWQQPIRIRHLSSGTQLFLKEDDRIIYTSRRTDSAVILFPHGELELPEEVIPLLPSERPLGIGTEVGWLGYPYMAPSTLCFFSGNISARVEPSRAYMIDGVAINGVSGGPVIFSNETDGVQIVGIVSAYKANKATGGTLPGLLISQDVSHFHAVIKHVKSIDEAASQEKEIDQKPQELQERQEAASAQDAPAA